MAAGGAWSSERLERWNPGMGRRMVARVNIGVQAASTERAESTQIPGTREFVRVT